MARLIDADSLIEWLTKPTGFRTNCEDCCEKHCIECVIDEAIKNEPTVDAVEVVHGEWEISRVDPTTNYIQRWRCTVCNKDSKDEYDYCPHCGADMRRRKKDEM